MSIESGLPSRVLYTSVGKGGRYVRLGVSNGAGSSRGERCVVYRDVESGGLFHRAEAEFPVRMSPLLDEDAGELDAVHDLLPCPFCGGAAWLGNNGSLYRVVGEHADGCVFDHHDTVLMGPATDDVREALICAWNRRAALQAQPLPARLRFPVMLRRMWSGGEVQAWLDEGLAEAAVAPPVDMALAPGEAQADAIACAAGREARPMSLIGANGHTSGPLSVRIKEQWPFAIETLDEAGELIFAENLPCISTRDTSLAQALSGVHFDAHMRDECVELNARALANIRLRAIAPDLWEACSALLAIPQLDGMPCEALQGVLRDIRAVMAKAAPAEAGEGEA